MWTHSELKSNQQNFEKPVWRIVEGQYTSSTMKLAGTLEDQQILENLLEDNKPPYPDMAEGFDYLLATPFRYRPYPHGSRFRKVNQSEGAFYASLTPETAIAEIAFYKMLFFSHAEGLIYPRTGCEHTALQVPLKTTAALDLTEKPFNKHTNLLAKGDYTATQQLADCAREINIAVIISQSVRCPTKGMNATVLNMNAFASKKPAKVQTWKIHTRQDRVIALCEFPKKSLEFLRSDFEDARLSNG